MSQETERNAARHSDDAGAARKRPARRFPLGPHLVVVLIVLVVVAAALASVAVATSAPAEAGPATTRMVLVSKPYTPQAASGATDDYHCTLLNPHVTHNSYVISSQFNPGSPEDHHAVLSLVPPSLAATARQDNAQTGDKGWTCFGAPSLPGCVARPILEHALSERLGSGPRRRRAAQGDGDRTSGREPRDHAGPLQPARRRQTREELARARHASRRRRRCCRFISTWRWPRRTSRARLASRARCATGRRRSPTRRGGSVRRRRRS